MSDKDQNNMKALFDSGNVVSDFEAGQIVVEPVAPVAPLDPLQQAFNEGEIQEDKNYFQKWGSAVAEGAKKFTTPEAKQEMFKYGQVGGMAGIGEAGLNLITGLLSPVPAAVDMALDKLGITDIEENPNQDYIDMRERRKMLGDVLEARQRHGYDNTKIQAEIDRLDAAIGERKETVDEWYAPPNPSFGEYREKYTYDPRLELGKATAETVGGVLKPVADAVDLTAEAYAESRGGTEYEKQRIKEGAQGVLDVGLIAAPVAKGVYARTPRGRAAAEQRAARAEQKAYEKSEMGQKEAEIRAFEEQVNKSTETAKEAIRENADMDLVDKAQALELIDASQRLRQKKLAEMKDELGQMRNQKIMDELKTDVPEVVDYYVYLEQVAKTATDGPIRTYARELLKVAKEKPAVFTGAVLADSTAWLMGIPQAGLATTLVTGGKVAKATRGMLNNVTGIQQVLNTIRQAAKKDGIPTPRTFTFDELKAAMPEEARTSIEAYQAGERGATKTMPVGVDAPPLSKAQVKAGERTPDARVEKELDPVKEEAWSEVAARADIIDEVKAAEEAAMIAEQKATKAAERSAKADDILSRIRGRGNADEISRAKAQAETARNQAKQAADDAAKADKARVEVEQKAVGEGASAMDLQKWREEATAAKDKQYDAEGRKKTKSEIEMETYGTSTPKAEKSAMVDIDKAMAGLNAGRNNRNPKVAASAQAKYEQYERMKAQGVTQVPRASQETPSTAGPTKAEQKAYEESFTPDESVSGYTPPKGGKDILGMQSTITGRTVFKERLAKGDLLFDEYKMKDGRSMTLEEILDSIDEGKSAAQIWDEIAFPNTVGEARIAQGKPPVDPRYDRKAEAFRDVLNDYQKKTRGN